MSEKVTPCGPEQFKSWYDAVYLGDGETGLEIPKSVYDAGYSDYMHGYTLAYGAWIQAAKLCEMNKYKTLIDQATTIGHLTKQLTEANAKVAEVENLKLSWGLLKAENDKMQAIIKGAQEQKPVVEVKRHGKSGDYYIEELKPRAINKGMKLYARPPMPVKDEWVQIDSEFLKNKPEWFHGDLWVSFCCEKPVFGKYEWVQGWSPDRIITVDGTDYCALGIWVRPAFIPDAPQSEVKPS